MRTRRRVRWWSRRERLLGGGNISSCLMACPTARAVELSSSLTRSTVLEESGMHRSDGIRLLHTSIVALFRSTLGIYVLWGWMNRECNTSASLD
jgi:hypothetical protein